jgi:uncharacterized OB-fold protein
MTVTAYRCGTCGEMHWPHTAACGAPFEAGSLAHYPEAPATTRFVITYTPGAAASVVTDRDGVEHQIIPGSAEHYPYAVTLVSNIDDAEVVTALGDSLLSAMKRAVALHWHTPGAEAARAAGGGSILVK